jgi:hypothetical protein
MQKIMCIFLFLFSSLSYADEDIVRIFNNHSEYKTKLIYKICTLDVKTPMVECYPEEHALLENGELDITVPNFAFDVHVVKATELNSDGSTKAEGGFPEEEDCKGFVYHPVTLDDQGGNIIHCIRAV